jgi:hypothetical protein
VGASQASLAAMTAYGTAFPPHAPTARPPPLNTYGTPAHPLRDRLWHVPLPHPSMTAYGIAATACPSLSLHPAGLHPAGPASSRPCIQHAHPSERKRAAGKLDALLLRVAAGPPGAAGAQFVLQPAEFGAVVGPALRRGGAALAVPADACAVPQGPDLRGRCGEWGSFSAPHHLGEMMGGCMGGWRDDR